MDDLNPISRLGRLTVKYKYALVVLLLGLGLMMLGSGESSPAQTPPQTEPPQTSQDLESRLEQILGSIQGAGEVRVLLTQRTGPEYLYQTDEQTDQGPDSQRRDSSTILIEDEENRETGLLRRTDPPTYLGALVVCQGGDDPAVKLAIVESVRCVTGLGADQITVVKMK